MKKLIFIAGSADSSFVKNEIGVLKEYFDDICVITYPIPEKTFQGILTANNIRGYIIPKRRLSFTVIRDCVKWLSLEHVRNEIKNQVSLSIKGIKRFFYILHYGLSVVNSYRFLKKEINNEPGECEIYLYAFWMTRPSYIAALFKWTYKEKITKIVARAHGYDLYEERNAVEYLPFRQFISANMDEIHFISNDGRAYYNNETCIKYHISKTPKLFLNYLGTYNEQGIKKIVRDKKDIIIASCAFVSPVKRLDLIIDFLSVIEGISVRWIHIGAGKLLDDIKTLTKERIPNIDVHFYGNVENEMVLSVYEKEDVDFFVNMSDSEGLPVSIMEAMSMGIPVIARNVGGNSEIVNSKNGCLIDGVDVGEKELFRQFVMLRVERIDQYQILSENAFKTWQDKYNADINYRKFCEEVVNEQ